jgi:glycosyltransferase involved in cell wall biosynthesis
MNTLKFSVIIPTLNEEKFLPYLLHSLTRQTIKHFEVIIVDGNSKDDTVRVAKKFESKFSSLRVVVLEKEGVSRQRNAGAQAATTEWLVFIDADTVLLSNFFERVEKFIVSQKPRIFTTWYKTDSDEPGDSIVGFMGNMIVEGFLLVSRPLAPGPLTLVKKKVFMSVGGYDEDTTFGEDHDLGMKIHEKGIRFQILREILYIYSLRRYRQEGSLKAWERYAQSSMSVLLTKRGPKHIPGFISGGHLYNQMKKRKKPMFSKKFETKLKRFMREFIE